MTRHTADGSRTYGNLTFLPDPDCEKFAFNQPGMATSRAELLYMFSQPGSLDNTARPAVVLTGVERYEQGRARYAAWLAEIAAFNAGNAPQPRTFDVPSTVPLLANDDEPGPVVPFRKRRKPAPAPVV